ncbi:MAG: transcriptional regulator [Deltaproteobacteria bacterium RBG_16_54_11]|jgi:dTDP-4-amino-4,6-dideoxygalactose transaminase|nr:MAG: transcriptional regulator [Deltaproteobacteria bacterium RBG_16_54_11]
MKVQFLDLKAQYSKIKKDIDQAVAEVISEQHFILGPKVEALEETIAAYSSARYGIGVASGSDALALSLLALGIGSGDEVITTPFTFFATAGSVSKVGAKPVFVDIDPKTYNLDPGQIEERITSATKAVMPVHLFGQCADMEPINDLARRHNLWIIEDAAQAIGSDYKKDSAPSQRAGSIGDVGCFSFYPSKNLGGFGDGGMVTTNDDELAQRLKLLRVHGASSKYYYQSIGVNSRLDALQAAVLLAKFRYLEEWTDKRRENAAYYNQLFEESAHQTLGIELPSVQYNNRHIYNQYVIRVPQRDEIREFLTHEGIGTDVYYPLPLHLQGCYRDLGYKEGDFPHAEKAAQDTLALPIYPELTGEQQEYVVSKVAEFFRTFIV